MTGVKGRSGPPGNANGIVHGASSKALAVPRGKQGILLAERLRRRGITVKEFRFTGESRRKLFGVMLDLIRAERLKCRPHPELRRELLGLEVEETAGGFRVNHKPGQHDDHCIAVALAAQEIVQKPKKPYVFWDSPDEPTEPRQLSAAEQERMWTVIVPGRWH